jgi:hypothetical protein
MIEVTQFASPDDCRTVIEAYDRCRGNAHIYGEPFFDGRVMFITSFPDSENQTRRILQDWRNRETAAVIKATGQQMYPDTIQVVRWTTQAMPPHQDDRHPDGSPNPTPYREWAGVIYLNDDYEGGRLYFPETNVYYKPVVGSLVLFPAVTKHGVEATQGGARYASPAWFTRDPAYQDPLIRIVF